jgi:hypothetical protein
MNDILEIYYLLVIIKKNLWRMNLINSIYDDRSQNEHDFFLGNIHEV